jgi:hypothetical protein
VMSDRRRPLGGREADETRFFLPRTFHVHALMTSPVKRLRLTSAIRKRST